MLERDLKTYAFLGRALWPDPERSRSITVETLSAVSLLDLTEERAVERASAALLERAMRQSSVVTTQGALDSNFFTPFFKLLPEERFLLVALHLGRWSYARLARVMKEPVEKVEALAWKSRVRLGASHGLNPLGAKLASVNCPEYVLDRPWTQRFLDEEIPSGRDQLFLRNHVMACDSCRQSLTRCRNIYFKVESLLPKIEGEEGVLESLLSVAREGIKLRTHRGVTVRSSLWEFLGKTDVQVVLGILIFLCVAAVMRSRIHL